MRLLTLASLVGTCLAASTLSAQEGPPPPPPHPVNVTGILRHPQGVTEVRVGDRLADLRLLDDGSYRFTIVVPVPAGVREVMVEATSGDGERFSAAFAVQPAWEATSPSSPPGQRWSVSVGVADFTEGRPLYNGLTEGIWWVPDSVVTVVGLPDTLSVRLGSAEGEAFSPLHFDWTTTDPRVVRVDPQGILYPGEPGSALVEASAFNRSISVRVRVLNRPLEVYFRPSEPVLSMTRGETMSLQVDLELPGGVVAKGALPRVVVRDTQVVRNVGRGTLLARQPGATEVVAFLGGASRTWTVRVDPPAVRIRLGGRSVPLGSEIPLVADFLRRDGSVMGEALSVRWTTAGNSLSVTGDRVARAQAVGRSLLVANALGAADTVEVFVLGDLVVATESEDGAAIETVSLDGSHTPLLVGKGVRSPSVSPDGRQIAFVGEIDSRFPRIYLMDADGGNVRRLTPTMHGPLGIPQPFYQEHGPAWAANGQRVFFTSNATGSYDIYSVSPTGSDLVRVTQSGQIERGVRGAPVGEAIVYERVEASFESDIWMSLADGTEPTNLTAGVAHTDLRPWRESRPTLLPQGRGLLTVEAPVRRSVGEALAHIDIGSRRRTRQILIPVKGQELIYALSPSGTRLAYHHRPYLGRGDPSIVIADLEGQPLANIWLPAGTTIRDIAWGASMEGVR